MKINFDEDNSFLELLPSEDNKMTLIMCGRKSLREVTMSSAELTEEQVAEIIDFFTRWKNEIK